MKKLFLTKEEEKRIKKAMSPNRIEGALEATNKALQAHGVESRYRNYLEVKYVNWEALYRRALLFNANSFQIIS